MKKIIIPIGVLMAGIAHAQLSPTENYVYSKTYLEYSASNQPARISETVEYFDGLGRPKQVVNIKASPKRRDVVTQIEYDGFGRQVKDYLPVPQDKTLNGAIVPNPLNNSIQVGIYGQEKIYAEKTLENSPLDRLLEQKQVGTAWSDKPVKFQYDANVHEDYVRKYKPTTTWDPIGKMTVTKIELLEYFLPNTLYKNTVNDEDGNKTIEFKNGRGQVVLVRKVISSTENADTYYVYNEYDQLVFVIPPGSPATPDDTALNNFCYQYRYDGKNRLVEKKLPGKGWEFMVYDKADRVVLTRDANLEAKGQWLFTKYDQFSRPVYTGILDSYSGRSAQAATVDGFSSFNEVRSSSSFNNSGMDIYYTNSTYPQSNFKLLSVNYYDTYPAYSFNPSFSADIFAQPVLTDNSSGNNISTKGLPVMTFIKNIEDDNWTKNYNYYDTKGRLISTHSINHLDGYTRTSYQLSFAGLVKQTATRHKRLKTDAETSTREFFTYDSNDRLLTHTHQVNGGPIEYLSQNTYNELSQLESKKIGGATVSTPLQQVDYKYNIRGWMTQINDLSNLNGKLFGYEIRYNNPVNTLFAISRYNGNIAEVDWKTSVDNVLRRYSYSYDNLNRLNYGHYSEPNGTVPQENHFGESLEYDLNGNITRLYRNTKNTTNGLAMQIDNLKYSYIGNRLFKVEDASKNSSGYPYFATPNVIDYDNNGNMTKHKDKGINEIKYNFLNLPNEVITSNTIVVEPYQIYYTYRADGTKTRKKYTQKFVGAVGYETMEIVTDYLDGFQYAPIVAFNNPSSIKLQFIPTSEGYYDFVKNKYIYNYTDHLGNVRLSYTKSGSGTEIIEENNYYPFGLKHEGYNSLAGNLAYQYKYQGQELQQETGWYNFKWRNYDPTMGRFFNIDPLAEKYPYNSTYAFQENKMGMGVELEGLELLKNHTGFFAINGNAMKVKRAPVSQTNSSGQATFTAGDIGLSTAGYNPDEARFSSGSTGLRLNSYKYSGPVPDAVQMQNTRDKISNKVRQSFKTTKTGSEMWNIKQYRADQAISASSGVKEIVKLVKLGASVPDAIKSTNDYVQATKDVKAIEGQAMRMNDAINYVDQSGINMSSQTRNDVINYIFDGTLPDPDAGLMPNSLIIQNGTEIMRSNGIPIQPLDEQLTAKNRNIPQ
ncbi:DUF6443 domain-containing protein [Chryseobacterium sp. Chry.R1]|uniref:DUF6443 domain-containing protein n=1 Tax=Chryseobacterium sp. Chry.R1 TaxID=3139392 RepID=UPI0031F8C90E